MEYLSHSRSIATLVSDCLVVAAFHDGKQFVANDNTQFLDGLYQGDIKSLLKDQRLNKSAGSTLLLMSNAKLKAEHVFLVSLGQKAHFSARVFADAMAAISKKANEHAFKRMDIVIPVEQALIEAGALVKQAVLAIDAAAYQYDQTKSKSAIAWHLKKTAFVSDKKNASAVSKNMKQAAAIASGVRLTKDLANLPGNICTPSYLAKAAKKLAKTQSLTTKILDEKEMKQLKMGSLLSVSRGSREPAKLITMTYNGGKKNQKPIVLVGKGLTFDAGGISIKPAAKMDEMKYDMCGGASVFGVMQAVAELGLKVNLIGVVPSSENLPDGASNKPGDIVTSMAGKTIEILNTDAEGRLILCDALTYVERFKPEVVIDIATLTGACVVALGHHRSGLFSDDDRLADDLMASGEAIDDGTWRMPIGEDYSKQLKSNFADLANIGGMPGGAVTAASFLQYFTGAYRWAHLDIAGVAWQSGGAKGATGRPVPMLVEFIAQMAK